MQSPASMLEFSLFSYCETLFYNSLQREHVVFAKMQTGKFLKADRKQQICTLQGYGQNLGYLFVCFYLKMSLRIPLS